MNKKDSPNIGHNKKSLLSKPVEHIDITSFDARNIIKAMGKMSFTSRDTASAAEIFNEPETKGHKCALGEFCHFTGYMPANSVGMFQNHVTDFKDVFGLRRSKKKATYGNFIDRESFKNN